MRRANSLEKILMLGQIEGRSERRWQRMRWLDGIIDIMNMSLSKLWEIVKDGECWPVAVYGITKSGTWLRNWTATMKLVQYWPLLLTLILSNCSYQAHSWSIPSSHSPWLISDLDRFVNSFLRGAPLSPPPRKHYLLPTLWSPWVVFLSLDSELPPVCLWSTSLSPFTPDDPIWFCDSACHLHAAPPNLHPSLYVL